MQFGLTETQLVLKNSAREFFSAECPNAEVRRLMETDTVEGTVRMLTAFKKLSPGQRSAMEKRALECYQLRYALKNAAQEVYKALGLD